MGLFRCRLLDQFINRVKLHCDFGLQFEEGSEITEMAVCGHQGFKIGKTLKLWKCSGV